MWYSRIILCFLSNLCDYLKLKIVFGCLVFFTTFSQMYPSPPILLEVEFLTQYVQTIPPTFFNLLVHIVSDSPPGGFHLPVPIFIGCFLFWTHLSIWVFYFSLLSLRFPFSFSFFSVFHIFLILDL